MIALAASLFLALVGAPVEVDVAPDQPLPHVYAGEPLIIEFRPAVSGVAQVRLEVRARDVEQVEAVVAKLKRR